MEEGNRSSQENDLTEEGMNLELEEPDREQRSQSSQEQNLTKEGMAPDLEEPRSAPGKGAQR